MKCSIVVYVHVTFLISVRHIQMLLLLTPFLSVFLCTAILRYGVHNLFIMHTLLLISTAVVLKPISMWILLSRFLSRFINMCVPAWSVYPTPYSRCTSLLFILFVVSALNSQLVVTHKTARNKQRRRHIHAHWLGHSNQAQMHDTVWSKPVKTHSLAICTSVFHFIVIFIGVYLHRTPNTIYG